MVFWAVISDPPEPPLASRSAFMCCQGTSPELAALMSPSLECDDSESELFVRQLRTKGVRYESWHHLCSRMSSGSACSSCGCCPRPGVSVVSIVGRGPTLKVGWGWAETNRKCRATGADVCSSVLPEPRRHMQRCSRPTSHTTIAAVVGVVSCFSCGCWPAARSQVERTGRLTRTAEVLVGNFTSGEREALPGS